MSAEDIYLNQNTSLEKKLKIMDEEVSNYFANAHRWDMASFDDEKTCYNVANYDYYLNTFLSEVENKEQMYIEYLKCYLDILSDPFFYEKVPLRDEFIKEKCKEFNLLKYYFKYYEKVNYTKDDLVIFSEASHIFSQWYLSKFEDEKGILYNSSEQYMMAQKALLFNDDNIHKKIMDEDDLSTIKKFGREVNNFDNQIWDKNKEDIVYKGNYFKFTQNEKLSLELKATGNKLIVEANPNDFIWSCGLKPNDENIYYKTKWKGANLLGEILMKVREILFENEYRNMDDFLVGNKVKNEKRV